MQNDTLRDQGDEELFEDEEEFSEEQFEDSDEYDSPVRSEVTPSSICSHYDPNTTVQFIGYRINAKTDVVDIQIPPFVSVHFTGTSLSADNFSDKKHILCCKYNGVSFTLARLIPNQIETQPLDFTIPAVPIKQQLQLYQYNSEGGALDVCVILSMDQEMMEDQAAMFKDEKSTSEEEVSWECDSETPNEIQKEQKYNQEIQELYQQQARAKALEYKISRASNDTNIKLKDIVVGSGETALSGKTVSITYEIFDYKTGKLVEKAEDGKLIQFMIGRADVTDGVDQLVTGMRVGGTREGIGPSLELMGTKEPGVVRMVVELKKIE